MVGTTKHLSIDEMKWVKQLEDILMRCPSNRLGAYTVGDNYITLYDRSFDGKIDELQDGSNGGCDFAVAVDSLKCELGMIKFPFNIHSTAG